MSKILNLLLITHYLLLIRKAACEKCGISLTPDQERFIQTKLQTGKYSSAEEALEIDLRLLDEYDRADAEWIEDVREKIDAAILASGQTPPIDGETFVNQILERFR